MAQSIQARWRTKGEVWYARFRHPLTGERIERSSGCRAKRLAEEWLEREWLRLLKPEEAPLPEVSLADAVAQYLVARGRRIEAGAADADRPSTLDSRKRNWRGIIARLGADTPLSTITEEVVVAFREDRLAEVSAHTVYKLLCELRIFFRWCVERGYLRTSPADGVTVAFKTKKEDRAITPEEFARLHEALPSKRRPYVLLMVETGVRPGEEAEGILWGDVDPELQLIHIRGTKTEDADRFIPIREGFATYLEGLRNGVRDDQPIVERWSNSRRDLYRACEKAGVRRIRPYDLRHTYASWALQGGAPDSHVAKALGHSSTAMVHRVYGHLRPEHLRTVTAALPPTPCVPPPEKGLQDADPGGESGSGAAQDAESAAAELAPYLPQEGANSGRNRAKSGETGSRPNRRNHLNLKGIGVARDGIEPPTQGFSVPCSTC